MSTANIAAFQDKVSASAELQSRLAEIQRQAALSTAEAIAALATETGTPFTADELLANPGPSSNELQDSELESVAGGFTDTIVSKEPAPDSFGNLWGLLGPNYRYTTEKKGVIVSYHTHTVGNAEHFGIVSTSKKS